MENNVIIIGIFAIIGAGVFATILLKAIFKKTIVATVGILFLVCCDLIAIFAFFVGSTGLHNLFWGVPASILVLFITYYLLSRFLQLPLKKMTEDIEIISLGNLTIKDDEAISKRTDELGQISRSVNILKDKLSDIINTIKLSSVQLNDASMELSSGAEQLSQGTNEQAASVEEVLSSIEEMSSNITQTAENSSSSAKITQDYAEVMRNGFKSVKDSETKILEISKEISIINDIAFQTNILALNAAVEAASAGVHGKGFSVVTSEVKKLAGNSKKAADEIVSLSDSSVEDTERANVLIGELMPDILKTAELVKEISAASQEQNSGVQQVSNVIHELNKVAQENSIASEEISDIAGKLNKHAGHLSALVDKFKV